MQDLIPVGFAIIGLGFMFLNLAVINYNTTINRWIEEITKYGRIKSGEVSDLRTAFSFDYMSNMGIDVNPTNRFTVLRNPYLRDKIREVRKLRTARLYAFLALLAYIALVIYFNT